MSIIWADLTPIERSILVAEKVMGWRMERSYLDDGSGCFHELWFRDNEYLGLVDFETPCYSTEIADAWQVVEKLQDVKHLNRKGVRLMIKMVIVRGRYQVAVIDYLNEDDCIAECVASSAPEAICLAALKVFGIEVVT